MKTNVYVDGFNFYYGALKNTPCRWLDLSKFCSLMLPKHKIHRIKYFTALVKSRPSDLTRPVNQQIYLRALKTIPNLSIIYGHYLSHKVWMPLASSWGDVQLKYAEVVKTEEKGSDVNLATHLMKDAYQNDFEVAVVVSNDSDLQEPIKIVRKDLRKKVGVINPHRHPSRTLLKQSDFFKSLRKGALKGSQFSDTLKDKHGTIRKPQDW